MAKTRLTEQYQSLFQILDHKDSESWQNFFGKFQYTVAELIFGSSQEFHEILVADIEYVMHPCIRLIGYYKATQEEPNNLEYLEQFKETLNLYYAPESESKLLPEIQERIDQLKNK